MSALFYRILAEVKNKTLFDKSLLEVKKELPYGVFSEDSKEVIDIQQSLDRLINNLAIDNIIPFTAKVYENIALGKKLNSIHPLTTFEYFLSDEKKEKVYHIYDHARCKTSFLNPYGWVFAYLKDESIKSYAHFLKQHHEKDDLVCHIDDFSKKSGLDGKKLIEIINDEENENRFINFVKIILENRSLDAK